jgi:hypothetical protein
MMTKSNITVRSNVFVRKHSELKDDVAFIQQVRGRSALLKLLGRIPSQSGTVLFRDRRLSQRQIAELAWEVPCAECGAIPEGPVTRMGHEEIEFRCPRGRCGQVNLRGRTVLLDPDLVQRAIAGSTRSLTEVVQLALKEFTPEDRASFVQTSLKRPFPIRVTLSQHYFYSDRDIEMALEQLSQKAGHE